MKWGAAPRNHLSLPHSPTISIPLPLPPFLACTLPHSVSLPASRSQTHRQMQTHTHTRTHTLSLSFSLSSLYPFPTLFLIQLHTYSLFAVCLSLTLPHLTSSLSPTALIRIAQRHSDLASAERTPPSDARNKHWEPKITVRSAKNDENVKGWQSRWESILFCRGNGIFFLG